MVGVQEVGGVGVVGSRGGWVGGGGGPGGGWVGGGWGSKGRWVGVVGVQGWMGRGWTRGWVG